MPDIEQLPSKPAGSDLYSSLLSSDVSENVLIKEWLANCTANNEKACENLKNLVVRVCGCSSDIPTEFWEVGGKPKVIAFMTENTKLDSDLLTTGKVDSDRLKQFISELAVVAQCSPLLNDDTVIDRFIFFLENLSRIHVSSFRYVAVFFAWQLMLAFSSCDNSHFPDQIVDKILAPSTLDKSQRVRLLCIEAVGTWMLRNPNKRIIHWNLLVFSSGFLDHDNAVRQASLKVLDKAFDEGQSKPELECFARMWKETLLDLASDRDEEVRKLAQSIVKKANSMVSELFSSAEIEKMGENVDVGSCAKRARNDE